MSCGLAPWICFPFHMILPAVGASIPAIRLRSVVLPEPLGPSTPMISPLSMPNDKSETAVRPSKRLVRPVTSNSIAASADNSGERPVDALRHHQDGKDQDAAVDD